jgi:hypothetical protein
MEAWQTIPGFVRYQASTMGRLRSTNYKNSGKTKLLHPALAVDGYLKTMLQEDSGRYRSWTVHKFVMLAFVGQVPVGLEVNHKNGVKTDNRIVNLEYVTRSQNVQHSFDNGLQKPLRGSANGFAKLTEVQVGEIRKYRAAFVGRFYGRKELAKRYGVSVAHIKEIVNRRRDAWSHV